MFSGMIFQPDRFVGGDDPGTTVRALVMREQAISGANLRLLNWLAVIIQQNGGAWKLDKEEFEKLPPRFGIHHRHDANGAVILSVVEVTNEMFTMVPSAGDGEEKEVTRANAESETEPTSEELKETHFNDDDTSH